MVHQYSVSHDGGPSPTRFVNVEDGVEPIVKAEGGRLEMDHL